MESDEESNNPSEEESDVELDELTEEEPAVTPREEEVRQLRRSSCNSSSRNSIGMYRSRSNRYRSSGSRMRRWQHGWPASRDS